MISTNKYKKDFPLLKRKINGKNLVYLDNSATSQMPTQVFNAIKDFEFNHRANVHRGAHTLSEEATEMYESARKTVAEFIGAVVPQEIIFTKNTTESINLVVHSWGRKNIFEGDIIVLFDNEHHSNLIPWQILAKEKKAKLEFIPVRQNGDYDLKKLDLNWKKVKVVSVNHVSNVLGTIIDVKELVKFFKKKASNNKNMPILIVDGAQSVPHMPVDVKKLGVDFFAFSGHKMCGPMGIGVLWGRREVLDEMEPYMTGGGMIGNVEYFKSTYASVPEKFEAGTPNVSGAVGLAAACDYLTSIGMDTIYKHEQELTQYVTEKFNKLDDIEFYGSKDPKRRSGLVAFNIKGIPAHDLAAVLDSQGVAIRSGYHCVMPWHVKNQIPTSARASYYFYNDISDIDKLLLGIAKAKEIFSL